MVHTLHFNIQILFHNVLFSAFQFPIYTCLMCFLHYACSYQTYPINERYYFTTWKPSRCLQLKLLVESMSYHGRPCTTMVAHELPFSTMAVHGHWPCLVKWHHGFWPQSLTMVWDCIDHGQPWSMPTVGHGPWPCIWPITMVPFKKTWWTMVVHGHMTMVVHVSPLWFMVTDHDKISSWFIIL